MMFAWVVGNNNEGGSHTSLLLLLCCSLLRRPGPPQYMLYSWGSCALRQADYLRKSFTMGVMVEERVVDLLGLPGPLIIITPPPLLRPIVVLLTDRCMTELFSLVPFSSSLFWRGGNIMMVSPPLVCFYPCEVKVKYFFIRHFFNQLQWQEQQESGRQIILR